MNKAYDKILLGLALLLVVAAAGYFLMKSGSTPSDYKAPLLDTAARPFDPVTAPTAVVPDVAWPAPSDQYPDGEQADPWLYHVFTPPEIYYNPTTARFGQGVTKPPPPFGIVLDEIRRIPYRLQLEGTVGENPEDPDFRIILYNAETDRNVFVRVGDQKPEIGVRIEDFTIDVERDEFGSILDKSITCTITDLRTDERIVLNQGEVRYEEGIVIVIALADNPANTVELSGVGERFEMPTGNYLITNVDFDSRCVEVIKEATEEHKEQVRTLCARAVEPEPAPAPALEPEPEAGGGEFDLESMFDL